MFDEPPQTWDELAEFDQYLKGPPAMPSAPTGPAIVI
jgi:hypothetical protein